MGYEVDGLALCSDWVVDHDANGRWINLDTVDTCLFEPLRAAGMFSRATHFWVGNAKATPIRSAAALIEKSRKWRTETVALFTGHIDDPDWMFHLALDAGALRLVLGLGRASIHDELREQVEQVVLGWSRALAKRGCRLSVATLAPSAPYPRPRPPRVGAIWPLGALDYYLGRRWHEREEKRVLAALRKAKLPKGVKRSSSDDVVRLSFPADLADARAVATARAASEAWLTPLVPTTVARGWNEEGDRLIEPPIKREQLPRFTYYDPRERIAYKGLITDPETHEVDAKEWEALVAIARAGKHGAKRISSIRLIFPSRVDAVAMHEQAIADGFEMVTYPVGKVLWQVGSTTCSFARDAKTQG